MMVMVRTNEGVIDFLDGDWYLDDGDIFEENVSVDDNDSGGQGGRSCTGARVASAEKFRLGRKF